MDFEKPTVQVTKINELPRMYENWTDFHFWWESWIRATKNQTVSIIDYGSGVVTETTVEWQFVLNRLKIDGIKPKHQCVSWNKMRALYFLWKSNTRNTKMRR